jgi:hypothetical protein
MIWVNFDLQGGAGGWSDSWDIKQSYWLTGLLNWLEDIPVRNINKWIFFKSLTTNPSRDTTAIEIINYQWHDYSIIGIWGVFYNPKFWQTWEWPLNLVNYLRWSSDNTRYEYYHWIKLWTFIGWKKIIKSLMQFDRRNVNWYGAAVLFCDVYDLVVKHSDGTLTTINHKAPIPTDINNTEIYLYTIDNINYTTKSWDVLYLLRHLETVHYNGGAWEHTNQLRFDWLGNEDNYLSQIASFHPFMFLTS